MKVLQALLVFIVIAVTAGPSVGSPRTPRRIEIVSKRFSYEPSDITVKKNQPVTLVLHTDDVTHGLIIKELGIKTEVKRGLLTEVTFTPNDTGDFMAKCSHFCGVGHGSMTLKVHVTE